jgi:STE24 endopeptidase
MFILHALFLALLLGTELFFLVVDVLNLRYGEEEVHENEAELNEKFNVDDTEKLLNYQRIKTGFAQLKGWIYLGLTLLILYSGIFSSAVGLVENQSWGPVLSGTTFVLGIAVIGFVLSLPFSAFSTFVIEEIFDFNQQTVSLWITDKLKGLGLTLVFSGLIAAPVFWFITVLPNLWWAAAWGLAVGFGLLMQIIYPRIIAPLFNDFEPVEEGELATAIEDLFDRAGFECSDIFTMDASRRSSHSNAYFVGFGRTKRVVLFDTLLDQMEIDNIQSVLAHELAHWKKGHVWKGVLRQAVRLGVVFYVLYWLVESPYLYEMFSLPQNAVYAGLVLSGLVMTPVNQLLSPLENYFSIQDEREADEFAVELMGEGESMIEALYRLVGENLSNPYPHPLYAAYNYTHPPIPDRVRHIAEQADEADVDADQSE